MKKLLVGLFILVFLFVGASQAHASILSDALAQIKSLKSEILSLKTKLGASVLSSVYSTSGYSASAYSTSGINTSICKTLAKPSSSFCPNGTIETVKDANSCISYKCTTNTPVALPSTPTTDKTNRISVWQGKVNQHVVAGDVYSWQTDADGLSGAELNKLAYCKKFYPNTTSVTEYKNETINTWYAEGNKGNYTGTKMSYKCTTNEPVALAPSITVTSQNESEIVSNTTESGVLRFSIKAENSDVNINSFKIILWVCPQEAVYSNFPN